MWVEAATTASLSTNNSGPPNIIQTIIDAEELRDDYIRFAVLLHGRIDVLCSEVLGYIVKPFHKDMIDFQVAAGEHCLQLAPRGFGKSTILTVARTVYEIVRNPNIRILFASNTQIQSEMFLREVKALLASENVERIFGKFQTNEKWDAREILVAPRTTTARESTVTCVGVGGPVASRHYDLLIGDDLVDEENARTEGQREKTKTWFYKVFMPCVLDENSRVYLHGTRYHPLDLYGYLIENEYKGHSQIIPAIAEDGSTPWPERFSLEWLEEKRRQSGTAIFNSQYQNDTALMRGNIFRQEWFRYYNTEPDWSKMQHFIGCDPAATKRDALVSEDRPHGDWWTICVGASQSVYQNASGDIHVRELWRDRCTKDAYLKKLVELNKKYRPTAVGIEAVAAQEYLVQDAERLMPVRRIDRTVDKVARAYWLQPLFENRQILFPDKSIRHGDWQALEDELLLFPQGEHDDLFDALQTMCDVALQCRYVGGTGLSASSQ